MNKKGFTLVELLAVLFILAIIALITIPVIMNVFQSSKENAFIDTAHGLVISAGTYQAEKQALKEDETLYINYKTSSEDEKAVLNMLKRADRGVVVDFMKILLSGDTAAALEKADEIYTNGADLSMLLSDMMEWTHWATRMHPALHAGDIQNSPYTIDQREQIKEINSKVSLNTLSRIWQVMVAAVPEMQAAGNQKQCFDMLVVRLMHIADMPSIPEILKKQESIKQSAEPKTSKPLPDAPVADKPKISSASELATALQSSKEILLYSYYSSNIEIVEFSDGKIKYFDRKGDLDFTQKLSTWLSEKTGHPWILERQMESTHTQTVTEQKQEELEADPMVASAMSLFEDAEIVGVSK